MNNVLLQSNTCNLQVAETEKRSITTDESPFLLSAAAGVSHEYLFS